MRRIIFFVAWPLRAPLALFGLLLGAIICTDSYTWNICKRDARAMLKAWPEK